MKKTVAHAALALCLALLLPLGMASATGEQVPVTDEEMREGAADAPPAGAVGAAEGETGLEPAVARAVFTSAIADREPVDTLAELPAGAERAVFFTELRGLSGRTVTHRWEWNGTPMAEVSFDIGGDRWRVHSEKRMSAEQSGRWSVVVTDDGGRELARQNLDVPGEPIATRKESEGASEPGEPPAAPE